METPIHTMAAHLLAGILCSLAAFHFYWAAGGQWGNQATIPHAGGKPLIHPGAGAAIAIAVLLLIGATGAVVQFDPWLKTQFLRAMALVFALRALGDFHYIGFFKQSNDSLFAYWDTRLFSPLCVLLAILAAAASFAGPTASKVSR